MTGKCDDCGVIANLHTLIYGTPSIPIVRWGLCRDCKKLRYLTIEDRV